MNSENTSRDLSFVAKPSYFPGPGGGRHLLNTTGSPTANSSNHPSLRFSSNNNGFDEDSNIWGNFPDNSTVTDDRSEVLTWLSPLEPHLRHNQISERRVDSVGDWLLRTEKFRRWCSLDFQGESRQGVLFCYGNPGVGKTYIR